MGTVYINFSTLFDNRTDSGGGLYSDGVVNIGNSIISQSIGNACGGQGPLFGTRNPIDDESCGPNTDRVGTVTLLDSAPRDNGGPTQTHALLSGSNAIDAASNCSDVSGNEIATDQRGISRPNGDMCDIGAFEFVYLPLSVYLPRVGNLWYAQTHVIK
jgi:hypothetical protein